MYRMGLVKEIDSENKKIRLIGFGMFLGEFAREMADITVSVGKVRLDNGTEVWTNDCVYYSSEGTMNVTLEEFKAQGYEIIVG
jgi:hypothetical protein